MTYAWFTRRSGTCAAQRPCFPRSPALTYVEPQSAGARRRALSAWFSEQHAPGEGLHCVQSAVRAVQKRSRATTLAARSASLPPGVPQRPREGRRAPRRRGCQSLTAGQRLSGAADALAHTACRPSAPGARAAAAHPVDLERAGDQQQAGRQLLQEHDALALEAARQQDQHGARPDGRAQPRGLLHRAPPQRLLDVVGRVELGRLRAPPAAPWSRLGRTRRPRRLSPRPHALALASVRSGPLSTVYCLQSVKHTGLAGAGATAWCCTARDCAGGSCPPAVV